MREKRTPPLLVGREKLLALVLILFGCFLRLLALHALPFGLNQDEASSAYEAFALLRSGMDRCGNAWPVLLVSWGSGQNALLSYLAIPFVSLLGNTETAIRLPCAIAGCITLPVFWLLARQSRGSAFGLTALALLALNPWHIMAGRWALESNLLPALLLTGMWLTVQSRQRPWMLVGAGAAYGLSFYAYGTAFFFLPVFLSAALFRLRRRLRPASFLTALTVFLLLTVPIALCQARNALGLDQTALLWFTLPRLTEGRQAATSVFGGSSPLENLKSLIQILWTQNDGLVWNSLGLKNGGIYYFFGLPTAVIGVAGSLCKRKEKQEAEDLMGLALLSALICGLLIQVNINRINMLWPVMIYFSALGIYLLLKRLKYWAVIPWAGIVLCFLLFLHAYIIALGGHGNTNYFPGLGQAIRFARKESTETVYITNYVNQPYIFALYYDEILPETFLMSVEYRNAAAAFRQVNRFTGYEFQDRKKAEILILHRSESTQQPVLAEFGEFRVCIGKERYET